MRKNRFFWAAWICLLLLCGCAILFASAPPVRVDSLVYHLALPKLYLRAGGWVETPANVYSYFPNLVESGYYLLMRLGVNSPQLLHTIIGFAVLAQTWSLARRCKLDKLFAWVAVFGVLVTPEFYKEMTWAYVDLASIFFWLWGIQLFLSWRTSQNDRLLCWMGIAAAGAVSVKYTGLLLSLILALLVLLEIQRVKRRIDYFVVLHVLIAGVLFLGLTSWWWIRNLGATGNPVFPFFVGLFGSENLVWDADRIQLFQQFVNQYGGVGSGGFLYRISGSVFLFFTIIPSLAQKFDGVFNLWFLVAFCSLSSLKKHALLRIIWLVIVIKGFFWIFSTQQVRFALELVPFFSIVAAFFMQEVTVRVWPCKARYEEGEKVWLGGCYSGKAWLLAGLWVLFAGCCALNLCVLGHYFHTHHYFIGIKPSKREDYIERRLPYYKVYQYIHKNTAEDANVGMVLAGAQTYYLDRAFFTDTVFEERRFKEMLTSAHNADEVYEQMRQDGWDYMLTYLPAYQPASWLEPEYYPLMHEVFRRMTLIFQDRGYLLFRVPKGRDSHDVFPGSTQGSEAATKPLAVGGVISIAVEPI